MHKADNLHLTKRLISKLLEDDFEVLVKHTRSGIKIY